MIPKTKEFKLTIEKLDPLIYRAVARYKGQVYRWECDDELEALIVVRHSAAFSHGDITFTGSGEDRYQELMKEETK